MIKFINRASQAFVELLDVLIAKLENAQRSRLDMIRLGPCVYCHEECVGTIKVGFTHTATSQRRCVGYSTEAIPTQVYKEEALRNLDTIRRNLHNKEQE